MGNAPGLYDKAVLEVSIKNQIKWRNNLGKFVVAVDCNHGTTEMIVKCVCVCAVVRFVQKDERKYYEALLQYSREHFVVSPIVLAKE